MHPRRGTASKKYHSIWLIKMSEKRVKFDKRDFAATLLPILPLFIAVSITSFFIFKMTLSGWTLISNMIPVGIRHVISSLGIAVSSSSRNDSVDPHGDVKKSRLSFNELRPPTVNVLWLVFVWFVLVGMEEPEEKVWDRGEGHSKVPVARLNLDVDKFLASENALSRTLWWSNSGVNDVAWEPSK